ncbi:MAG TPA: response regulator, partial [Trueperaceae bacterium]|nr:response regulator [Trueperaceae bacterium]
DEVVDEHEVVVKPLGPRLPRVRNVAGATVLQDGRVAPVLNVTDLLQGLSSPARARGRPERAAGGERRRRVLVVEDSITSRSLFKGILEAAGYSVTTAVDGIDAFLKLEAEPVDLIVTDVDMPRLNGLELTARVRADKRFAELPVIVISSLGSPQDVERGVEVGANAYMVKSEFDQRGMLDAVRRLIG